MEIKDKVCIVTGGTGLFGFEFSELLLEVKGIVCLLDIDSVSLNEKIAKLEVKYPHRCLGLWVSITNEKSLTEACDNILSKFSRVDVKYDKNNC